MQEFLFPVSTMLLLLIIAVEDFRSRSIRVIWFALLFGIRIAEYCTTNQSGLSLKEIGINWLVLLIISIVSISILRLLKKVEAGSGKMIGVGDFLMLFFIGTIGSLYSFMLLFVLLCIATLLTGIVLLLLNSNKRRLLPLAGVGAAICCTIILTDRIFNVNIATMTELLNF
jgi:hypothetical protein